MSYYDNDDYDKIFEVSKLCGFNINIVQSSWGGSSYKQISGTFTAPTKNLYFEIKNKPSRKGTIGRLINAEIVGKYSSTPNQWHLAFDDRKNVLKMDYWSLTWLPDYSGPTVYNYIRKDPKKQEPIPPIKNKFGQTFEVGDLVIAIGGTKGYAEIVLGNVTRWTKARTLYLKPYGPFGKITNSTQGDTRIRDAKETIIVPKGAELEKDLFSLVLGADYK